MTRLVRIESPWCQDYGVYGKNAFGIISELKPNLASMSHDFEGKCRQELPVRKAETIARPVKMRDVTARLCTARRFTDRRCVWARKIFEEDDGKGSHF
jgi:hypothetical protein